MTITDPQTESSRHAAFASPPQMLFGDRFLPTRVIKRVRDVTTYVGRDVDDNSAVVIKTAPADKISAGAQLRLKYEAAVLHALDSPGFVPLIELGRQDDQFYLVSPYVKGRTLRQHLNRQRLSVSESLRIARELLAALQEAHQHGILHRDVRPENLVVSETNGKIVAKLIDFGLGRLSRLDVSVHDNIVNTVQYQAPEQYGLIQVEVGPYSDLYAVGAVLFECLVGQPPFQGDSISQVLHQHMTQRPADLASQGILAPRVLNDLIQRLMRKDPGERYQTAEGVLADIDEIADAVAGGKSPSLVLGARDRRRTLTEPAFVGRGAELQQLELQFEQTRNGNGRLVFLEADSGGGKTRLIKEFLQRRSRQGAWTLHGFAFDQVGQRPFRILDRVVTGVISAAQLNPALADDLRKRLGTQLESVSAALPGLGESLGWDVAEPVGGPEAFAEARTLQALGTFLTSLATQDRPAVVVMDDCQWADEQTLRLIANMQRRLENSAAPCQLMLLVAFRTDEVDASHALRAIEPAASLVLTPFCESDIELLVESMAGQLPEEAIAFVKRLSEGNPFMAKAMLRGMVESEALVAEADGWRVAPQAMEDVQSSRHAASFLSRRLEMLPADVLKLLTAGAVQGKEFDLDLTMTLSGQSPESAIASFDEARRRHMVWEPPDGTRCEFVHNRLREILLSRVSDDDRKTLHRRAARYIELKTPDNVYDLAYHFDAAGDAERALPFALQAAEQARKQHSLAAAAQQYRIAERSASVADPLVRYRIAEGLGTVLMLQGDYEGAAQVFQAAAFLATTAVECAKIEGLMGELAHKKGDMETASECIQRALQLLGKSVPGSKTALLLQLVREAFVQSLHTMLPKLFVHRRGLEPSATYFISGTARAVRFRGGKRRERPEGSRPTANKSHPFGFKVSGIGLEPTGVDFTAIRLLRQLSYAYWFSRGTLSALWAHLRGMNLAERYPESLELAHAYANHGPAMSTIPWFRRGHKYAEKSLEIRTRLGDLWGQAHSRSFHGVVLYANSRFAECIDQCRQAIRLFERTGDYWEMTTARYEVALSLYRLGNLRGATEEARRMRQIGLEHGDKQATGMSLDVWVMASRGNVPADTVQFEVDRDRNDPQTEAQVLLADGVRLIYAGSPGEAATVLTHAERVAARAGIKHAWVAPIRPWLATARRMQVERTTDVTPSRKRIYLKNARRAARRAIRIARSFKNEAPHALRESALLSAMGGRRARARRLFDRSLKVAEKQGAKYEIALSLSARGRVGREWDWPTAESDLRRGEELLGILESSIKDTSQPNDQLHTLSLADRFDTLLNAGRRITSALTRDRIFEDVRDASVRLLRAEHCFVIPVRGGKLVDAAQLDSEHDAVFAKQLTRRAIDAGAAMIFAEGASGEANDIELAAGVRSAIAVPIFARENVVACFYATHKQFAGLFGETEKSLGEFIAAIAGAALENAEGFALLEDRVALRTEELARSNEELEQFAYVASHDLQEPLRTIASYCQILKRRYVADLDEKAIEFIDFAVDGATRMRKLISDLLTYSRVGTRGKEFVQTDANAVVERVIASLKVHIEDHQATVTHDFLPTVLADETQISQLFQNLIGNAIKFCGDEPPQVHVSCTETADGKYQFSVRDHGIGIDPDHFDRVFQIFQRLHTRQEYEGTGIGLAVCKKTVERHGGAIWVNSETGKGCTFHFTIPKWEPGA